MPSTSRHDAARDLGLHADDRARRRPRGRRSTRCGPSAPASQPARFLDVELPTWIGEVAGLATRPLPADLADFDCRNNRLAWLGVQQDGFADAVLAARERWGAHRVAVLLGTSTAGLLETELGYRRRGPAGELPDDVRYRDRQNTYSVGAFVTARVRPARAELGRLDRLLVERQGVRERGAPDRGRPRRCGDRRRRRQPLPDDACTASTRSSCCRPRSAGRGTRSGAACRSAKARRSRCSSATSTAPQGWLLGVGESNDGYHMSTPHPEGAGAIAAMRAALADAALGAGRHRLHQPARHRDAEQRRGRGPRGRRGVRHRRRRAARPRARPATRSARPAASRRRSACWRCAKGCCRRASTCSSPIRR